MMATTGGNAATRCRVEVLCDGTSVGEELYCVGGCALLGRWDLDAAVKLRTNARQFPKWGSDNFPLLMAGEEFKFVIRGPYGSARWEPFVGNRSFPFGVTAGSLVRAAFGNLRVEVDAAPCFAGALAGRTPPAPLLRLSPEDDSPTGLGAPAAAQRPLAAAVGTPEGTPLPVLLTPTPFTANTLMIEDVCGPRVRAKTSAPPVAKQRCSAADEAAGRGGDAARDTSGMFRVLSSGLIVGDDDDACPLKKRLSSRSTAFAATESRSTPSSAPLSPMNSLNISHVQCIFGNRGKIEEFYSTDGAALGSGNSGTVRMATHKMTRAKRAVKTIHRLRVEDMFRFKQEIEIMKMMDHPNVIKLFEFFEDSKSFHLVMELCTGGDLFDHIISTRDFSEHHAALVMQQILRGVHYIHHRHVCHRDIKPENFLLCSTEPIERNTLKIIDFGLSSICAPGQILSTRLGTANYVAPEVIIGRYGWQADAWSCGVVLFVLLSGQVPFDGRTDAEIFRMVRAGYFSFRSPMWEQVSDDAKELIRSLMNTNPKLRATPDQALGHKWFSILEGQDRKSSALGPELLDNLKAYQSQNLLKKATLQIIAWRFLDNDRLQSLSDAFRQLDTNGDGSLSLEEIQEGLLQGGVEDAPTDLQQIVDSVDTQGNGTINYTAFLAATIERRTSLLGDLLQSAFNVFDKNGDGKLSPDEIREVLDPSHGGGRPAPPTAHLAERISDIIAQADRDGDGMIDLDEFCRMMRRTPSGALGVGIAA